MGAKADAKGDSMSNNTHAILGEYVNCIVYRPWLNN
jgi:hypothetical protein